MARSSRLNDTQLKLIQMFEFTTSKSGERELMQMLRNYYLAQFNATKKKLKAEGKINTKSINDYLRTHHHGKLIKE